MPHESPSNGVQGPAGVAIAACRAHLEKVSQSYSFGRARQLRKILLFLGERALAAPPVPPTEKEIGVTLLNRPDFDPQTDSIVRKEMGRLRERLVKYYTSEGAKDPVEIQFAGTYLPTFRRRPGRVQPGQAERWLVMPFRSSQELSREAECLMEELLISLSEAGGPELISSTTALGYRGRTGDVREFAAECGADLVVEGSLRLQGEAVCATAWLVDGQNGLARSVKKMVGGSAYDLAPELGEWLLAQRLAPV